MPLHLLQAEVNTSPVMVKVFLYSIKDYLQVVTTAFAFLKCLPSTDQPIALHSDEKLCRVYMYALN